MKHKNYCVIVYDTDEDLERFRGGFVLMGVLEDEGKYMLRDKTIAHFRNLCFIKHKSDIAQYVCGLMYFHPLKKYGVSPYRGRCPVYFFDTEEEALLQIKQETTRLILVGKLNLEEFK